MLRNTYAMTDIMSIDIKLSKAQLSKTIQSCGCFPALLGKLTCWLR